MPSFSNVAEERKDRFWGFNSEPWDSDYEMNSYTDFLFARPSFIEGFSRVLDIGCTLSYYNYSVTADEADARALWADWYTIGNDLQRSMNDVLKPHLCQIKGNDGRESR